MSGQHRLHLGQGHEQRVQRELERRGWHVQPWGQGLLDDVTRQALVEKAPIVLWRWMPDLIAVRDDKVALVDPKSDTRTDTPYYSIEISALQAHRAMSVLGLRIVYVWGDLTVNYPENLICERWVMPDPGRNRVAANGSGTPFALVRKDAQHPMDRLFGPVVQDRSGAA